MLADLWSLWDHQSAFAVGISPRNPRRGKTIVLCLTLTRDVTSSENSHKILKVDRDDHFWHYPIGSISRDSDTPESKYRTGSIMTYWEIVGGFAVGETCGDCGEWAGGLNPDNNRIAFNIRKICIFERWHRIYHSFSPEAVRSLNIFSDLWKMSCWSYQIIWRFACTMYIISVKTCYSPVKRIHLEFYRRLLKISTMFCYRPNNPWWPKWSEFGCRINQISLWSLGDISEPVI
jgi:hypothetical protein